MASTLNVIAIPKDDPWSAWAGGGLGATRKAARKQAPASGFTLIEDYGGPADLLNRIRDLQNRDPDHPCLRTLDIVAHGSPSSCNGVQRVAVSGAWSDFAVLDFAAQFCALWLCDDVRLFLDGCNTGLAHAPGGRSLAEVLRSGLTPFGPAFSHRIHVFGSMGYVTGFAMGNTVRTTQTEDGGATTEAPMYPGAVGATGAACWAEFTN